LGKNDGWTFGRKKNIVIRSPLIVARPTPISMPNILFDRNEITATSITLRTAITVLMTAIHLVLRLARKTFNMIGCIADAKEVHAKTDNNKGSCRIGRSDFDHKFSPMRKIAVVTIEANVLKVRKKFNRLLLSFSDDGINLITAIPNPNSETKPISPKDDIATDESPTASVEYNLVAIMRNTKLNKAVTKLPIIKNTAFSSRD